MFKKIRNRKNEVTTYELCGEFLRVEANETRAEDWLLSRWASLSNLR